MAFATERYYLSLLPVAILLVAATLYNIRFTYFLLLFTIPLSVEYSFSASLGTDLPDEPLMICLMFATLFYLLHKPHELPKGFVLHPIFLLLVIYLFWILVTAFTSVSHIVSFKYFLAKLWYVVTFTVLSAIILKEPKAIRYIFWSVFIPLTLLIIQVIIRHAMIGFSFDEINKPMAPFFRNHVAYAAIVTIMIPFIWLARNWYSARWVRILLMLSVLLYVVAVYFSYTRTCYLALFFIPVFVWIMKKKLMKQALLAATLLIIAVLAYLMYDSRYMQYAPEYEQTVIHDDFGEHITSTFEGKDVSSMERVYRWIAILHMWKDRPFFGFGPGNFYPHYKGYTVLSFETYVSENEERSTAHNYFLLLLAEQGVPGVIIFTVFTLVIFVWCERIYHRARLAEDKNLVMAVSLVLMISYVNLMLSDMLESDKVGPFYFLSLAVLIVTDLRTRATTNGSSTDVTRVSTVAPSI